MKTWLSTYKHSLGLLALFLVLSLVMPLFFGAFLVGTGFFASQILFDQGRKQFNPRKFVLLGAGLIFTATTIWAAIFFTPALHTDWETDSPYDGLIIVMLGVAFFALMLLLPLSGYVGDRVYRTRKTQK